MVKTVLITGPTSGIGFALATLFAQDDYELILVSRSKQKLEQTAGSLKGGYNAKSHIIVADLTQRDASQKIVGELKKRKLHVDVLVNNAGFGSYGLFRDLPLKRDLDMIQLNVTSLVELTGLLLTEIIKRKGKILNVASTAAFQPLPLMATYGATKAFVLSYSEALRNELEDSEVTVTTLCPGPTKTNFDREAHAEHAGLFQGPGIMSPDEVARIGYEGLMQGRGIVVAGPTNRAGTVFAKLMPTSLSASFAKKVLKRK